MFSDRLEKLWICPLMQRGRHKVWQREKEQKKEEIINERRKKKRKSKFKILKRKRIALGDQERDRADSQRFLYTVMTRTLGWTLAAVTLKERPLSLLWRSGQQHALLFVFQMPLWVRPLVYAQSACYNFLFTVGLWNSQRNVKLPLYDFVQFQMSNHHLVRVGKLVLNTFLFPVISLRPV